MVAYTLAGTMNLDLLTEALGVSEDGRPVLLADIWPSSQEVAQALETAVGPEMFHEELHANVTAGARTGELSRSRRDSALRLG